MATANGRDARPGSSPPEAVLLTAGMKRLEPDRFADVVTLFLPAGAKIDEPVPAAAPGTTGRGRPVGVARGLREDRHHARGEPRTWPTRPSPCRWGWCSPTGRRAR